MRWFTKFARPARPAPVRRTRLSLEALDGRAVPSSFEFETPPPTPVVIGSDDGGETIPIAAPQISDFSATQTGPGRFLFAGRVTGLPDCGGLTITLGGLPSLVGKTTTTDWDGTFFYEIVIGSETGTATAQTTVNGVASNLALCNVGGTQ